MKRGFLAATAIALSLLGAFPASAQDAGAYPVADGYVLDAADALSAETELVLEDELRAYEGRTTNQVAVAVVPSLGGRTVDDYATGLFNAWGVGQMTQNNGVLLLVATEDRKLRIEVGTGLTDELPDAAAASIVEHEIVPRLRSGDIEGGVRAGTIGIRRSLGDDVATPDGNSVEPSISEPSDYAPGFDTPAGDVFVDNGYPDSGFDPRSLLMLFVPVALVGFGLSRFAHGRDSCPNCGRALAWGGAARRGAVDRCDTCGFARRRMSGFGAGGGLGFGSGSLGGILVGGTGRGWFGDFEDDDRGDRTSSWAGSSWRGASGSDSAGRSSSGSSSSGGSSSRSSFGGGSSSGGGASGSW